MTNIHVAPYSKELIVPMVEELCRVLPSTDSGIVFLLDPCAGTGWKLEEIVQYANRAVGDQWGGISWWGIEIEPAYVNVAHPNVALGDSTDLSGMDVWGEDAFEDSSWDMGITSPTYGNGCNDNFKSTKQWKYNTYIHRIRQELADPEYQLHENNTGGYGWRGGKKRWKRYLELNGLIYREMYRLLKPGAPFIVNTKNFWSNDEMVNVTGAHQSLLTEAGFAYDHSRLIWTPGLREGENGEIRELAEAIVTYRSTKT